jgi:hypothetical protein
MLCKQGIFAPDRGVSVVDACLEGLKNGGYYATDITGQRLHTRSAA